LTGGANDSNVRNRNKTIEVNNVASTQQLERDFAKKKTAVEKLGKILSSVENQSNSNGISNLQSFRQNIINLIKEALDQDPKLTNADLDQNCCD
jgi:hypothetical protein